MKVIDSESSTMGCQSVRLGRTADTLSGPEIVWQLRYKLKRVLKRRINYLGNLIARLHKPTDISARTSVAGAAQALVAGQWVRVKSREEIQATLDDWNFLKGCGFMEEMWQYCDTRHRVLKPVARFLDERDYRVKRARGIVLLEGLTCQGTRDYGSCDRNCYYFWREEWLVRDDLPEPDPLQTPEI